MKKSLLLSILVSAGCVIAISGFSRQSNAEIERKKSMHDGVMFKGYATPIISIRHYLETEFILSCMKNDDRYRYTCQCGIDNAFKDMSADEVLELDWDIFKGRVADAHKKHCDSDPKSNIPKVNKTEPMLGGEMHSSVMKEIALDCITGGSNEDSCKCYAEGMSKSLDFKQFREFLEAIDSRKHNMAKYEINKKLYKDCGLN